MQLDGGFEFGLGAFETMMIYQSTALFLDEHLQRLNNSLAFLEIPKKIKKEDIFAQLSAGTPDYSALKIMVSEKNMLFTKRGNPYTASRYHTGFTMRYSEIRRSETSPFVFHKTLNYGDCILEKRKAKSMNLDELIFLNSQGVICEGTTCNIFFVKDESLFTPSLSCGILPGIIRNYICQRYQTSELEIKVEQVSEYEECFVTNSLMGIMPVRKLGDIEFKSRNLVNKIAKDYWAMLKY